MISINALQFHNAVKPDYDLAFIGGGASTVYLLGEILKNPPVDVHEIIIMDALLHDIGAGMPYSEEWNGMEHMSNITCEEIPPLVDAPLEWLEAQDDKWLAKYGIERSELTPNYIMPRLVLGQYLTGQLDRMVRIGCNNGLNIHVSPSTWVEDVTKLPNGQYEVRYTSNNGKSTIRADKAVIATGHSWKKGLESKIVDYFDSPWPIQKISKIYDHKVALIGTSLSAVDAAFTLAHKHGEFVSNDNGKKEYRLHDGNSDFGMVMLSRNGILPRVRSYYDDPDIAIHRYISDAEIHEHIKQNDGFLSLEYIFRRTYLEPLRQKSPEKYEVLEGMSVTEVVKYFYDQYKSDEPFAAFEEEMDASLGSLSDKKPITEKDLFEQFSFTTTFYARFMSAEELTILKRDIMPLVSIAISSLPLSSTRKLLALHNAGVLDVVALGKDSQIIPDVENGGATFTSGSENAHYFKTVIDCRGQVKMDAADFPFTGLLNDGVITEATVKEQFTGVSRKAGAVAVDGYFRPLDSECNIEKGVVILSNAYIGGIYPDHSGLTFCRDAAKFALQGLKM